MGHEALFVKDEKKSDTLRLTVKITDHSAPVFNGGGGKINDVLKSQRGGQNCRGPRRKCQGKKGHCQRNTACGFPFLFGMGAELDWNALLQDVLAHPSFAALLRAVADVLETAKATAHGLSPCALLKNLWRKKECHDLVQWLKSRVPELAPMLMMFDTMIQHQQQAATSSEDADSSAFEEQRRFVEVDDQQSQNRPALPTFNLEDILQHVNVSEIGQHIENFQQLFGNRSNHPSCFDRSQTSPNVNGALDGDVNLQAAIQRSLSKESNETGKTEEKELETAQDRDMTVTADAKETGETTNAAETEPKTQDRGDIFCSATPSAVVENNNNAAAKSDVVTQDVEVKSSAPFEKEIQMLRSMGFHDEEAIQAALRATDATADTQDPSVNVQYALQRLFQ